ncbi:hypothetical protein IRJ41_025193, partial [Triplophysa rosa]
RVWTLLPYGTSTRRKQRCLQNPARRAESGPGGCSFGNLMNSSEGEESSDVSGSFVLPEESTPDGVQQDRI